jgi:hypothetical protein
MSRREQASPESRPPLTVEQRIGYALAAVGCSYRASLFADQPDAIPGFIDRDTFVPLVRHCTHAAEAHLLAVQAALTPSCSTLEAPDAGGRP